MRVLSLVRNEDVSYSLLIVLAFGGTACVDDIMSKSAKSSHELVAGDAGVSLFSGV